MKSFFLVIIVSFVSLAEQPLNHTGEGDKTNRANGVAKLTDTQTQFLTEIFPNVGKASMEKRFSPSIWKAVQNLPPDDGTMARDMAALFNTTDDNSEVDRIKSKVSQSLEGARSAENRNDRWISVLERINWAAERMLGKLLTDKELAPGFQESFAKGLEAEALLSDEVKKRVANNDREWLRDPKNIDPEALVSFAIHTKNTEFANSLIEKMGWGNDLHLTTTSGKSIMIDHGGKPLQSLRALNLEGSQFNQKKNDKPDYAWHWKDGELKPGTRPGVSPNTLAQTTSPGTRIFQESCMSCHGKVSTSLTDFREPKFGKPLTRSQMIGAIGIGGRMPPPGARQLSPVERDQLLQFFTSNP